MAKKMISSQQKQHLIEFLEDHPEMIKNRQSNQYTNADSAKLWQEISQRLNSIPGATKGWKEWRKSWSDLKTRSKKKASENKKEINRTGGGPNPSDKLDEFDDKVLDMMGGNVLIVGLDVPEVGLPIHQDHKSETVQVNHEHFDIKNCDNYNNNEESTGRVGDEESSKDADENKNTELGRKNKEENKRDYEDQDDKSISKKQRNILKAVRPPSRIATTPKSRPRQATNRAAFDLVKVTEETNQINKNYYAAKLKIMEESLKIQKENLHTQKRIADAIESFLEMIT